MSPLHPCLTDRQIDDSVTNGTLPTNEQRHIEACASCRDRLERARADRAFLDRFAPVVDRAAQIAEPTHEHAVPGYRILEPIGRGAQGVVDRAVQESTGRVVALKHLSRAFLDGDRQRQRFEREIQLVAGLRHPNVVTVHDSGATPDGRPYLVMEYVHGVSLDRYLAGKDDPRSPETVSRLFLSICAGVSHAHQRGVIHRDLKPANILVDEEGSPRIVDFGLAKAIETEDETRAAVVTHVESFLGTLGYAAPEQVDGSSAVDTRSDVWALGAILYESLTGRPPFDTERPMPELVADILTREPPDPSRIESRVDADLRAIVRNALEKRADDRYPSVDALRRDLESWLAGEPVSARHGQRFYLLRKTLQRYRVPLSIAAAVFMLASALALLLALQTLRLERDRGRLSEALHERNLQLGRSYFLLGDYPAAEALLWEEYLESLQHTRHHHAESAIELETRRPYWALWSLYEKQPCLAMWSAHQAPVEHVAFTKSNDRVVSVAQDGSVVAVARTDASDRWTLSAGGPAVLAMTVSDDRIAIGREDGTVEIFPIAATPPTAASREWRAHESPVVALEFAPDGRLATADGRGSIRIWRVEDATVAHEFESTHGSPRSLRFRSKGTELAIMSNDMVSVLDSETGRVLRADPLLATVGWIAWSDDGGDVAWGASHPSSRTWIWRAGASEPRRVGGRSAAGTLLPHDRGLLVLHGSSGRLEHYDLERRDESGSVSKPSEPFVLSAEVSALAVASTGTVLATGERSGTVRLWDLSDDRPPRVFPLAESHPDRTFHSVRFDREGRRLAASGARPGSLVLWDYASGECLASVEAHDRVAASLDFSKDGRQLVTAGYDGVGRIWPVPSLANADVVFRGAKAVNWVEASPDGDRIAFSDNDGKLRVGAFPAGPFEVVGSHDSRVPAFAWSPDGSLIVASSARHKLDSMYLLHETTRSEGTRADRNELPLEVGIPGARSNFRCVTWSPDGRSIAAGDDHRVIRIWDADRHTLARRLVGHDAPVFAVVFHPEADILASGDAGGTIRLWDVSSGACLAILKDQGTRSGVDRARAVFSLDFDPTGRYLAVGGERERIAVWDLAYYDGHIAGNFAFHARSAQMRETANR